MSNVKTLSVHIIADVSLVMSKTTMISLALIMTNVKGILIAVIFNPRNFVLNREYVGVSALMRRRLNLKHLKCINNDGSYTCECFPGYDKAGEQCFDINECDDAVWQGMDPF